MPVQTSYTLTHAALYSGMLVTEQPFSSFSKLNDSGASIGFGKGVVSDGSGGIELPSASSVAADFIGVVKRELNRVHVGSDDGAIDGYDATVIGMGQIAVTLCSDVTERAPVFLRVGATSTGDFCAAAGTGATLSVAIPGAVFETAGSEGDIVNILLKVGG
jgi:hypothetical protein